MLKRLGIDVDDQLAQLATVASSQQAESERNHPPLPVEKLKNETNKRDRPKNMKDNKNIMHEELKEKIQDIMQGSLLISNWYKTGIKNTN